jgi:hypothetical protein
MRVHKPPNPAPTCELPLTLSSLSVVDPWNLADCTLSKPFTSLDLNLFKPVAFFSMRVTFVSRWTILSFIEDTRLAGKDHD